MQSSIKLSLREFDDGVRQAYARLFPGDPDKSQDILEWRFDRNPHGRAKFAVAVDGDDVVGMIALVPTRLRSGSDCIAGYQAIDTVVDPSYRGQGLFVKLGQLAQDPGQLGGSVLWGFPNANAAPGWYGRLGWTNFGAVPMLIRPLRTGLVFRRVHHRLRGIDLPLIRAGGRDFQPTADFDETYDALWTAASAGMGIAVDHSAEWMRWRLVEKPGADYRVVASERGGRLDAVVATRVADKHGARLCYCMEAVSRVGGAAEVTAMLRSELASAAAKGAEAALAWCAPHSPSYAAYRKAGFYPFPAGWRPIEINFGARALVPDAEQAVTGRWTISLLDSDTN